MNAVRDLPGLPLDEEGPVFRAPWQAQAFALALALHQRGWFSWSEWSAALGDQISSAQAGGDRDDGATYYAHWLNALEMLVQAKGLGDPRQLHALEHAWAAAVERTPHGQAIELTPDERALAHGERERRGAAPAERIRPGDPLDAGADRD